MGKGLTTLLLSCVLFSLCASSYAQTCKSYTFSSNRVFTSCQDLPVLNAFLHWSYDQSTNKVDIAYRHTGTSTSRWTAWAINPTGSGMVGAQALVAYQNSSSVMRVYTSPVSSYATTLAEGDLSFAVSNLSASFANSEMTIFATLTLPSGTTVNQVWQEGPLSGDSPRSHDTASSSANLKSAGSLNFLEQQTGGGGVAPTPMLQPTTPPTGGVGVPPSPTLQPTTPPTGGVGVPPSPTLQPTTPSTGGGVAPWRPRLNVTIFIGLIVSIMISSKF
ncbi:cytochrome b561 and DOMON domain-containing protein At5g47530-like [Alnus glutinosa]|uniref:cytochrome b561 and DOMON domain-containing protein At5g47530-like n=1 Tax=Alnus glutinosa TaxID=3517 RepID=UPI002D7A1F7F|nr:cytochrome b561 and DOMON domain-containing protein At5g47530-like [Alnus glutinosa]